MKKFSVFVFIASILLAVAYSGYAQVQIQTQTNFIQLAFGPALPPDVSVLGRRDLTENSFGDEADRARFYEEVSPCRLFDSRTSLPGYVSDSANSKSRDLRTIEVSDSTCGDRIPAGARDVAVVVWTFGLNPGGVMDAGLLYFTTPNSRSQGGIKTDAGFEPAPFAYSTVGVWKAYRGIVALKSESNGFEESPRLVLELYGEKANSIVLVDLLAVTTSRSQ